MVRSSRRRSGLFAVAAAGCFLTVAVIAVLVHAGWTSLDDVDRDFGTPAEVWSLHHAGAVTILLAIEIMFGTIGTVLYTLLLLGVLWRAGHHRAIVWTVVVMVGTSATTTCMKLLFRRQRPQWDDSVHTLTSYSFPSGHASGIASGMGVVVVLTALYVHRNAVRRSVFTASAALVVVVGADRILLGVHNLSDVLAGYAVAGCWVFTMLIAYPPELSPATRREPPSGSPSRSIAEASRSHHG